jgi:hypothetical protein
MRQWDAKSVKIFVFLSVIEQVRTKLLADGWKVR